MMNTLQQYTVRDACDLDVRPPLIVGPEEEFSAVIGRFASHPEVRGIFVADGKERLLGVITRTDLLDWARIRLGTALQTPIPDTDKAIRLAALVQASSAGQVMSPESRRAAVRPDDTLAHALRLMIELDLIVLPVVDETGRITGDLKLAELLSLIVEHG